MTARIFSKLILSLMAVLALALIAAGYLVTQRVQHTLFDQLRQELAEKAQTVALMLPQQEGDPRGANGFSQLAKATGVRVTWVDPTGRVLDDSDSDPARMENHSARPEIAAALKGQVGSSLRLSPTLGSRLFYVAIPFRGGALRLAVPAAAVEAQIRAIRNDVLLSTALAFLPFVILAAVFARYISGRLGTIVDFTRQLAEGNFRTRLHGSRGELGLLSTKLNETSEKLEFMLRRLEAEHAELEKLENIRKDFVINVSHELRTPLASIQGYTETLLDGAIHDPANSLKFLNIIRQNAERLARITADLLTLSRIELSQEEYKFASYYVNRILADNLDGMRPIAQRRGIQLVLDHPESESASEGAEVFCDAEAVHQILTNLLDNAIKYTPDAGIVTVGAKHLGTPGDPSGCVEFFVRDAGPGIPAGELPRLFERFYRVDKARSRALGGTGLGLAIVKHLTRSQGGEVRVESQVDKGSTFFFTLPTQDLGLGDSQTIQRELMAQ